MKTIPIYKALCQIKSEVEKNHNRLRKEPTSEGETHDKWEEEDDYLSSLEDSLDEAISVMEEAMEVRKSLQRTVIKI